MVKYRIKEIRREKGLTQEELSTKSGVSRATICALERDEGTVTTTRTLFFLAEALGVEMDELFYTAGA